MRTRSLSNATSGLRGVPSFVWWITGTYVAALLAYSFLMPAYRAPDEPQHIDLAHFFATDLEYPAWDDRDIGTDVYRSLGIAKFGRRSLHLTAEEATPKDERPSYEQLESPGQPTGINQLPQHPPLYYVVAGGAERTTELLLGGDDPSWDIEAWFYRLVSITFVAPLPLIIWATTRRLGLPPPAGYAACLLPLCIPQLLHIGASVNNDSLMMLAFWLLTPITLRIADGEVGPRVAAVAGLISGIGLLTKGFALVLPLWVGAALLIAWRRGGRSASRQVIIAGVAYGVVAFAVGGWWWLRNLVLYRSISPSRFSQIVPNRDDVTVDLEMFIRSWGYTTTRRFWGDFGWYDGAYVPAVAFGLMTAVVLFGIGSACLRSDRVAATPVGNRLLLAAPLLLLVATQFAFAFRGHLQTGLRPGMQGRYWFGAVASMCVVAALGWAGITRMHLRWLPLGVFVAALLMQATAVRSIINQYWGSPGSAWSDRIRAIVAWAALPDEVVAVGAVLGVAIALSTATQATLIALRGDQAPDETEPGDDAAPGETGLPLETLPIAHPVA